LLSTERNAADSVQQRAAGVAFQLIKPARATCTMPSPAAARTRARPAAEPPPPPPRARRRRAAQARKVLLAEDNPVNVEVASAMLEGLGLDVSRACNGEEALHSVQADDFDVILMDCQMPVMDGLPPPRNPPPRAAARPRAQHAHHRHHRQRAAGRPRILPGRRHGRLPEQALHPASAGATLSRWISLPRIAPPPRPRAGAGDGTINRQALDNIRALSPANGDACWNACCKPSCTTRQPNCKHCNAHQRRRCRTMRKAAHSLKSSAANVGADAGRTQQGTGTTRTQPHHRRRRTTAG
jgi:hypothetical protein